MQLNDKNGTPLYYQLKEIIKEQIKSKNWAPGEQIPRELDLAETFKLSRSTVRQAILELVHEGLLYRQKGRGTFVTTPKYATSFTVQFAYPAEFGSKHKLLETKQITPSAEIQEILQLEAKDKVTIITRLRYFNDNPVAIEKMYLPEKIFPNITKQKLTGRLYDLLQDKYSIVLSDFSTIIEPKILSDEELRTFHVCKKQAGLVLKRTCYNSEEKPLLTHVSIFRGDCCSFLFK